MADEGQANTERQVTIAARDGYPLAGTLVAPRAPSAALMVSSGTGFPREFYLKFAHAAAARGYAVVVYDYRGMGGSAPRSLRGFAGRISDWPRLDMPGVLDFLEREFPGLPLHIVGHSVGAQTVGLIPGIERVSRIAMIAGSTGYWRWHPMPYRLAAMTLWFLYGPLAVATVGHIPGGKVWQGLALPPGVFREWRRWCRHPDYFGVDFDTTFRERYFDRMSARVRAWAFTDDPIAHARSVPALLRHYAHLDPEVTWISPSEVGAGAIGHHGFFQSRFRDTLWNQVLDWLSRQPS